jgi:AcrR family transcriptional regulator
MTPRSKEAFSAMREQTQQKIETAAILLIAKNGVSVTVDDLAKAAGVSKGLLYNYYPSKEALIVELVRRATAISGESILAVAQGEGTAAEKIAQITTTMCETLTTNHIGIGYFMFMLQVGMSGFSTGDLPQYHEESPNPIASFAQIVVQGQNEGTVVSGDPVQLATTYWATIQGLCCYAIIEMPAVPNPDIINRLVLRES